MVELLSHDTNLWVAISFALFLFIAFKLGKKSILNTLDSRITQIRAEIETAERLRVEAQELLAHYQRKQRDAEKEAKDIVDRARKQAELFSSTSESELEETMKRRERQLTNRLKRMEESAISEIQSHAADIVVAATTEIISKTLDAKVNANLNNGTISAISENLN